MNIVKTNSRAWIVRIKKNPFKVRYINLIRGVKFLSNAILVLENSKELHAIARKNKKQLDYYVMVVFAGLHQPSKDIDSVVIKTLAKFVRRFKTYSVDLSLDFEKGFCIDQQFREIFGDKIAKWNGGEVVCFKNSLYANTIIESEKYFNLKRILLYDKYYKQKIYHKEKIPDNFKDWKRLELTFLLKEKFLNLVENETINESLEVLQEIGRNLCVLGIFGGNIEFLHNQIQILYDTRHKTSIKAWIKTA